MPLKKYERSFFWLHERRKEKKSKRKKAKENNYVLKDTPVASASKAKDRHDNG